MSAIPSLYQSDEPGRLEHIDKTARHYTGAEYPQRDRGRVSAWIELQSWYGWAGAGFWTG
jgi:hypothetical protein